jgi:hypothetical protein
MLAEGNSQGRINVRRQSDFAGLEIEEGVVDVVK